MNTQPRIERPGQNRRELMVTRNERGMVNLLLTIVFLVLVAALLQLVGVDIVGRLVDAFQTAVDWTVDKLSEGFTWLLKTALGRN